jgi:DNA-binding SARP family transcriptional activator
VEFHVLGPLEVTAGGRSLAIGGPRTRAVLALLLVKANTVVSGDRLAEELWPGLAGDRAAANLQVRLSELRRAFRQSEKPADWRPELRATSSELNPTSST